MCSQYFKTEWERRQTLSTWTTISSEDECSWILFAERRTHCIFISWHKHDKSVVTVRHSVVLTLCAHSQESGPALAFLVAQWESGATFQMKWCHPLLVQLFCFVRWSHCCWLLDVLFSPEVLQTSWCFGQLRIPFPLLLHITLRHYLFILQRHHHRKKLTWAFKTHHLYYESSPHPHHRW